MRERGTRDTARTKWGRAFTISSWVVVAALLMMSLCWTGAGWSWTLDLIGNFGAQLLVFTLGFAGVWLISRRWAIAAVALVACASLLVSLGVGRRPLLARGIQPDAPRLPRADTVRLFHYNASTKGDGASIEALMAASGAEVLSVACPPVAHQRDVIYGDGLSLEYPGKVVRKWRADPDGVNTDVTAAFVVSRWPLRAVDATGWGVDPESDYLIAAVVERPAAEGGEFAVLALHPRSPRNRERWVLGTLVVEAAAKVAVRLQDRGYAVVVLADLNSTPSGWRSRSLCHWAGLYRAKPLLMAVGTYPLPLGPGDDTQGRGRRPVGWGLGVSIDDAWVSRSVVVTGWGVLERLESEHVPIIVDARIPGQRALDTGTAGR